jgi:hypothetical protein
MKVLMENWRLLGPQYSFEKLCENLERGIISEERAVLIWEQQILNEADKILGESWIQKSLKAGYQMGEKIAGKAKELYDKAIETIGSFVKKVSDQALMLLVKSQVKIEKIIGSLKGVYKKVQVFCSAHPILCKTVKILLAMIAIAAVTAMFSNTAEAGIDTSALSGAPKGTRSLNESGVEMVKGFLALYSEDKDPETKQLVYDTYKWIETTQAAEGMVDVSDAPVLARKALQIVSETDPSDQEMYRKIAQDVVETTINITKSISVDGDTKVTSQSYRSLRALEENT